MTVEDRDLGYAAFVKAVKEWAKSDDPNITVGVHAEEGADLVVIAATNEFGSADGRIPERSFLRSTIAENSDAYFQALADGINSTMNGRGSTVTTVFRRIGTKVVGDVKTKIRDLRDPKNAASTIAKKGSSNPLIDSGRLRASIDFKVNL